MKHQSFHREISYGHRMMYVGPATLISKTNPSVIDVGCGDGYGYFALLANGPIATYFGIDINRNEIQKGSRYLASGRHTMINDDWLTYPEDKLTPADYVFCIEVIEHVKAESQIPFIEKCIRVMKKNLFLSTPPAERKNHGTLTIDECSSLLRSLGLDVAVVDSQWTTLYVCSRKNDRT